MRILSLPALICLFLAPGIGAGAYPPPAAPLEGVKRVLFLGDSITYDGRYVSVFETERLLAGERPIEILGCGLPSETVSGLSEDGHAGGKFPRPDLHERLDRVLKKTRPQLVFACYGMNDGIYLPFDEERFRKFQDGVQRLHAKVEAAGAKIIHLTPPVFDPEPIRKRVAPAGKVSAAKPFQDYDQVLERYSRWLVGMREKGWQVIDLHGPMQAALQERRRTEPKFTFAPDGVHPNPAGHALLGLTLVREVGGKAPKSADYDKGDSLRARVFKLVQERRRLLTDAWLTETGHKRPLRAGLPLDQAQKKAADIDRRIRGLLAAGSTAAPATPERIRTAVEKALPLLAKGAAGHVEQRTCFACHNQALPMLAATLARTRGLAVKHGTAGQSRFIAEFLGRNRKNYLQGKGQGGQADTAGYALFTLELAGWKRDATTEAVVEYLLQRDEKRDHWRNTSNRPPTEASPFTTTYLALRALRYWGTEKQQERIQGRIAAARGWLEKERPKDQEDRVFRLWGLKEAGAAQAAVDQAVRDLLDHQQPDGGWRQLDKLASDPYATGTALVALHLAGGLETSHPAYRQGVAYLLKEQTADGSWFVQSRSRPFQTYYESGFPHGKNQFISIAASGWATAALALTLPEQPQANASLEKDTAP